METVLSLLSIPGVQTVLISILVSFGGFILAKFVKDAAKRAFVEKLVTEGIPIAYQAVDEIARRTPNKIDDKVAEALRVLKDYVAANGADPKDVTAQHEARAKILFDALHAQDQKNGTVIEKPGA